MKRIGYDAPSSSDSDSSTSSGNLGAGSSPASTSAKTYPIKRFKTYKACTLCRQHKTRCDASQEFADGSNACRRCRHFNKRCSLEDNPVSPPTDDIIIPKPNPSPGLSISTRGSEAMVFLEQYRQFHGINTIILPTTMDEYAASVLKSFAQFNMRLPTEDPLRRASQALGLLIVPRAQISDTLGWERTLETIRETPGRPKQASNLANFPSEHPQDLDLVFRVFYGPWISWDTQEDQPTTSTFLRAMQHALAAQHLFASHLGIKSQGHLDIQAGLYRTMLGGTADVDDLRALHILALHASTASSLSLASSGVGVPGGDSELTMASALRLAGTMHLENYVEELIAFRRAVPPALSHAVVLPKVMESLAKCRLLYSLYITQCFMHVAKGHKPDNLRIEALQNAHLVFGSPHALLSTSQSVADARLVFLSRLCDIMSRAFNIPVPTHVLQFPTAMKVIMLELEEWRMDFVPFTALTDDQAVHENQHVFLQFHYCKLAVMARVILAIMKLAPEDQSHIPGASPPQARGNFFPIIQDWASGTISTAESLAVAALSLTPFETSIPGSSRPLHPLASAPDYVLSMVAISGLILVKAQLHNNRSPERSQLQTVFRSNEQTRCALLKKLMQLFNNVSNGDGDLAGRYAAALEVYLGILDEDRPRDSDVGAIFEGTYVPEGDTQPRSHPGQSSEPSSSPSDTWADHSQGLPHPDFLNANSAPMPPGFGDSASDGSPLRVPSPILPFSFNFESGADLDWGGPGGLLDMSLFDFPFAMD